MKEYTATGLISGGPTTLYYVKVIADGAETKAVLHNNTAASGDVVDETTVLDANNYGGGSINPPRGVRCDTGLYLTLTGAGGSVFIHNS